MIISCNGRMGDTRCNYFRLSRIHAAPKIHTHQEFTELACVAWGLHPISLHCVFICTWSLPLQGELPKSADVSTPCPVPSIALTCIPQTSSSIYHMPCPRPDDGNRNPRQRPCSQTECRQVGRQSTRSEQLKLEKGCQ